VVGADRIAANGDTANKIGTYSVAVLAKENGVPFYVAAPLSTIDLDARRRRIPIEERPRARSRTSGRRRSRRTAPRSATRPSTSRRRATSPRSSPRRASPGPTTRPAARLFEAAGGRRRGRRRALTARLPC
jgi:hypothetical protein